MFTPNIDEIKAKFNERFLNAVQKLLDDKFFSNCTETVHCLLNDNTKVLRYQISINHKGYDHQIVVSVTEEGHIIEAYCDFCLTFRNLIQYCPHIVALIDIIAQRNKEIFSIENKDSETYKIVMERFAQLEEQKRLKEREVIVEKNRNIIYQIADDKPNLYFTILKEKIRIIPIIKCKKHEYNNYNQQYQLSIKVGNSRMYIVKNIFYFLICVNQCLVQKYGKNLEFNHSIYNFDERAQKLISLLQKQNAIEFKNSFDLKSFPINGYCLDEIFKIYTNTTIIYRDPFFDRDEQMYYIADQPIHIDVSIDEEKQIHVSNEECRLFISGMEHNYITIGSFIYPLDEKNTTVCNLIQAKLQNSEFTIEGIEDIFFEEVYPRIYQSIEMPLSFKEKHPIQSFNIHSYIDYEKGIVTLKTKYILNDENNLDKVYELENLPNDIRVSFKVNQYLNLINELGFVNDKIENFENIGKFFKTDLSSLKQLADVYLSESIKNTKIKTFKKGKFRIGFHTNMLSVSFEQSEFSEEELYKILSDFRKHKKFTKLKNDVILEIPTSSVQELDDAVRNLGLDEKHLYQEQIRPLYVAFQTTQANHESIEYKLDSTIHQLISKIKKYKEANYPIPENVKPHLREYQIEAYQWLKTLTSFNFSGILADDMGLGKTIEMITLLESDDNSQPSLIISPKSLVYNWNEEIRKWSFNTPTKIIIGSPSERKNIIQSIELDKKVLYITSYDSLKNDIDEYSLKKFRFAILDEAQFIKNHETLKAKSVKMIQSEVRFALTGTPIENTVLDLWSIFDYLLPNYLYHYSIFQDKFEKKIVLDNNKDVIDLLVKKITPFVLRRSKQEVLKDLPPKIETITYVDMEQDQRKIYDAYLLKVRKELENHQNKIEILANLTRLREICVNPTMFLDSYTGSNIKTNRCLEIVSEAIETNHKVLIFSQFTTALHSLEEVFKNKNIPYFILTGQTTAEDRVNMAEEFNTYDEKKVFLVSLKAGGTGLNLIGADIVIHLDPWWNVSAENQATDRAHRIGQKRSVQVIKLIAQSTIEQKVLELQQLKKNLADQIINEGDNNLQQLSENDIKYILS